MGLFDFCKRPKAKKKPDVKMTYNGITFYAPAPITNDEYQAIRQREMQWLEKHYDLNSIQGVSSIPVKSDLPKLPGSGVTGDVDYYLRYKGFQYEKSGNIELALACLKKSNDIRMCHREGYRKSDYYSLVRMLARNGYESRAWSEKAKIDAFFNDPFDNPDERAKIEKEIRLGKELRAFRWMQEHIPDKCPSSVESFRKMRKQNTKKYQTLKITLDENNIIL